MDAKKAQDYINSLSPYCPPSRVDLEKVSHLKVNYFSLDEMPNYVQNKIDYCVTWIVDNFNPPYIDLVMSYVNGYPIDENTSIEDFTLLKKIKKSKLSDFDFIVPNIPNIQVIEQISPLIKIDMFKYHHKGVRKIRVYEVYYA